MLTKTIENILTILALTVFADKRVFSNEIDSFVNSARNLESLSNPETDITPAKLLDWFEGHREALKGRMDQRATFEDWLNPILDDLTDHPDRHAMFNRMIEISKSDGEVHVSEKALMVLAAKRWNIRLAA